jgi:hypothetical protein
MFFRQISVKEGKMANPRHDERDDVIQAGQKAARKAGEESSRPAHAMAQATERSAQAGADMLEQNANAVQQVWRTGSELATRLTERSTEQIARMFGISGEQAREAAEQSTRNMQAIAQSGSVLASSMQDISREWIDFTRKNMEQYLSRVESLMQCRTPQEFVTAQSEFVRDNLADLLESTRRAAMLSADMAEKATRKMTETVNRAPQS